MSLLAANGLAAPLRACAGAALVLLALPALAGPPASAPLLAMPARAAPAAAASGVHASATLERVDALTWRVTLRLTGVSAPEGASIRYSLSGPGQILRQDSADLPAGAVAVRELRVQVEPGQASYLNVFTRQRGRAGVVSIALPSQAPQPPERSAGRASGTAPGGAGLVVVPGHLR